MPSAGSIGAGCQAGEPHLQKNAATVTCRVTLPLHSPPSVSLSSRDPVININTGPMLGAGVRNVNGKDRDRRRRVECGGLEGVRGVGMKEMIGGEV